MEIWGSTKDEYLFGVWGSFKQILKHKMRLLFFSANFEKDYEDKYGESLNPYYVLNEVENSIEEFNLFKKFNIGELNVFRGQQHDKKEIISSAFRLGSPPPLIAKANRMSPPGISMFYGAFEIETCKKEIEDIGWVDSKITIGSFNNCKNLTLIDFSKLTQIPSIFDEKNRNKRSIAKFLISFINDLSIPVKPDDSVHIDYIPTQVVTEYIRMVIGKKKQVDGIIYNSVKNKGGKCVVLFVENQEIIDMDISKAKSSPEILDSKVLQFDNKTLSTIEII